MTETNVADLKEVVLQEIHLSEYKELERILNEHRRSRKEIDVYARIITPLSDNNYESLLDRFVNMENADKISVRDGSSWVRTYVKRTTEENKKNLAKIAENDKYQKGHFELSFKFTGAPRGIIEFRKHDGMIVGYKVRIPRELSSMVTFNQTTHDQYSYINGLWLPGKDRRK